MPLTLREVVAKHQSIALAGLAVLAAVCAFLFVAPVASAAPALPWTPPSPAYRIYVEADGLYRLDYAYLAAAGLPVDAIDPATFRMFYMGEEIPLRVDDGGDGQFNPGDALYFYGRSVDSLFIDGLLPHNKYTAASVFWLTYGSAAGLRMAERAAVTGGTPAAPHPRRTHIERQYWYRASRPMLPGADHWFADQLQSAASPAQRSYSFTDTSLPAGSFTGQLQVSVVGNANGPHHLRVYLNNNLLIDDTTSWNGNDLFQPLVTFSQSLLVSGVNTVRVALVSDVGGKLTDAALVDFVDIQYGDAYQAESNSLTFRNNAAGDWQYDLHGFTTPDAEVYDVTSLTEVARIIGGQVITETASFGLSFGDSAAEPRRYLAQTPARARIPQQIEPVAYMASPYAPANLTGSQVGADYIIITHPDFWAQAEKLAQHRARHYRVALIDARRVYDQFGGGHLSAEAIHDFLAQAYGSWLLPKPKYVLLFGDGTYDMRNYRGNSAATYLPPYLDFVDPDMGETAADNRFVTFTGDDNIPEMAIGRFVANTPTEAETLVQKTINYEVGCNCGSWNYNLLFLADDLENGGGNFYAYSDKIVNGSVDGATGAQPLIPSSYWVQKGYLGQTCDVAGNPAPANECRQQTVNALNGSGALLVNWVGHSTKTEWATELMMDTTLINQLTNGPCLPIHLAMTCLEGYYQEAGEGSKSLAEVAVTTPVHGAVASWSPTGLGLVTGHDALETGLLIAMFHKGISQLGAAAMDAKQYLWDAAPDHRDLNDTFVLFGDPALEVKTESVCLAPTAVTIENFVATAQPKGIRLTWSSADEREIVGYNVLRREVRAEAGGGAAPFVSLTATPILAHAPGLNISSRYSYGDAAVRLGAIYEYALEVLRVDGDRQQFGPVRATAALPRGITPPVADK